MRRLRPRLFGSIRESRFSMPRSGRGPHAGASFWSPGILSLMAAIFLGQLLLVQSMTPLGPSDLAHLPSSTAPSIEYGSVVGNLPIPSGHFTENRGQLENVAVRYYASHGPALVGFTDTSILIKLVRSAEEASTPPAGSDDDGNAQSASGEGEIAGVLLRVSFDGARVVSPWARNEVAHRNNYFLSRDPAAWQMGVRSYREVVYANLYDGIDLVFRADPNGVKYEFIVREGGDPRRITMRYEGADSLRIDETGLLVGTPMGTLRDSKPIAYQDGGDVECNFALRSPSSYGFNCESWDPSLPLVIDPLLYSTFLGGGFNETGKSIAVDSAGYAYVAGYTWSVDFPTTPGAFDTTLGGPGDAYVTKLDVTGSSLVYSTYIGGSSVEDGVAVAFDSLGNAYLAGFTLSTDFPVTPGAFDTTPNGNEDAFAVKLDGGGGLVYSTYLGGAGVDYAYSIDVDTAGSAYVAGHTRSGDFPVTPGAFDTSLSGATDGFATKLSADGGSLLYSTYIGGSSIEDNCFVAVDSAGSAYLTGITASADFPVTAGAFDTTFAGNDAFVTKLSPAGDALVYSSFLGGSSGEFGLSITVDSAGSAYVTGYTWSTDYPVTPGSFDTSYNGGTADVFVTKMNGTGSGLVYSTYLGGANREVGLSVAVDSAGRAYMTGSTQSSDFPVTPDAFDATLGGTYDAFVTVLNAAGAALVNSTYLGGSLVEEGLGVAVDPTSAVYLTGYTLSTDFPVTPGAYDTTLQSTDVFVTKMDLMPSNQDPSAAAGPDQDAVRNMKVELNGSSSNDPDGDTLSFLWTQVSGSGVVLNDANLAVSWFVPAALGSYGFRLDVSDGRGGQSVDFVNVTVLNLPPVGDAGSDQVSLKNTAVTLDGSRSSDPDGDALSFSWTQIAGPAIGLNGPDTSRPTFTPRASGTYSFRLNVTDALGATSSDTVNVTVTNRNPVADAGPDQDVRASVNVVLDGLGSNDPDGDPLTFSWAQVSGRQVEIRDAARVAASFLPTVSGVYVFELTVSDGDGGIGKDTAIVTVAIPPEVTADFSDGVEFHGVALLSGTASNGSVVWLSIDDGAPIRISATDGRWTYSLDTTRLADGTHTLSVKAEKDGVESEILRVTFVVINPVDGRDSGFLVALVGAAVGTTAVGATLLLSEPLRVAILGLGAIVATRLRGKDTLDQEKRGMIRGYLLANPGANFSSIREDLGIGNGTLAYHLSVLQKEGLIRSWTDGRFKRFADSSHHLAKTQPKLTDIELILLQTLRDRPSLTQDQLARELGVSQPAVSYHIKKLAEKGFLRVVREGIRKHYFANLEEGQTEEMRET